MIRGTRSRTPPKTFAARFGPFRPRFRESRSASTSRCLAQQVHRLSIVRSMSHDDPAHLSTAHRVLTGHLAPTPYSDAAGPSPRDWPHLGAIVSQLRPTAGRDSKRGQHALDGHAPGCARRQGPGPGRRLAGQGVRSVPWSTATRMRPGSRCRDSVCPRGSPPGVWPTAERCSNDCDDIARSGWNRGRSRGTATSRRRSTLWSPPKRAAAFQIEREDPKLRDRYGRHIHGQCLLLARRLIEAGVGLVTVNWHNDGQNFWDTHGDNFNQLKNRLMPPADQGFSALLEDLAARGLLDETLVVWVGEFGRTPRINRANSGREHWPHCYSAVLAGAGVRGGSVHGASDRWAAYPASDPVSPDDLGATILHALGIDPGNTRQGRRRPPSPDQRGHCARELVRVSST